jgi:hypothetical protein
MLENYVDTNGYVLTYAPKHHRAIQSGSFKGYVYEHILIAEKMLGRELYPDEVVHHLDGIKTNNNPYNLLVLLRSQHTKLHHWMRKHWIISKPSIFTETKRCVVCNAVLSDTDKYCSVECSRIGQRKIPNRPDLDQLGKDVISMPMTKIGEKYGVSDNAVRKWCTALGLPFKKAEIM